MTFNSGVCLAFIVFLSITIAIGLTTWRKVKTTEDYIFGSRSLGTVVTALAVETADMSAWLFMGLPGAIYIAGTGEMWIALGLLIGTILNWTIVAKKIRIVSEKYKNTITIPSLFSKLIHTEYNLAIYLVKVLSSLIIIIYFTLYTASGFEAGGKFFSYTFGLNYYVSLLITAAIIVCYTLLGGFLSISWNSVVQGIFMLAGIMAVPIAAFWVLGGLSGAFAVSPINNLSGGNLVIEIISSMSWALGYFGMPHILIRFMAQKDVTKIRRSGFMAIVWCFICLISAILIGEIGRSFVGNNSLNHLDSEKLFALITENIFVINGNFVLSFIGGLILCAVLAAILSTVASQMLMVSSSVSVDLYSTVIHGNLSAKKELLINRYVALVVAIMSFLLAINPDNSVMDLVSTAWAGLGATFGPLVLLLLYWKKVTGSAAILGMLVGSMTVFAWPILPVVSAVYSILPGFILSFLIIIVVSKLTLKKISQ
ncbi:MAG: sodium/proline symporter [Bifidobacteriaceae bacterium]|jgi:sodium/proline symporter|nr:sodium/proline symporter [Bifidobacteriaceae bacterium]